MIFCSRCGAENYAIDMWCAKCSHHLDWASPAVAEAAPVAAAEPASVVAEAAPLAAEPAPVVAEAAPVVAAEPAPVIAEPAPVAAEATPVIADTAPVLAGDPGRRRTALWILPVAAAALVAVLLALPVAGWLRAPGQQAAPRLPITAGLSSATPSAPPTPAAVPSPTDTPSPTATPVQPSEEAPVVAQPAGQQPATVPASQTTVGDPTGAVGAFYQAVAAHQFDAAAATWSARMQANYPPPEFINRRFAYTQQMNLRAARTVANDGQFATVYIDLIEVYAGSTRHWVGSWQLIRSSSGWLLNQPNLQAAS